MHLPTGQSRRARTLRSACRTLLTAVTLALAAAPAHSTENPAWSAALAEGRYQSGRGNLTLALDALGAAERAATTPAQRATAAGELGAALAQARRYDEADVQLRRAYDLSTGAARARYAADLGNVAALRKRNRDAERYFAEARAAATSAEAKTAIDLNLARLAPVNERLASLDSVYRDIERLSDSPAKARLYLNLGIQARALGNAGVPLAYRSLDAARGLLRPTGDSREWVDTLDALAQLYEDQGRDRKSTRLNSSHRL